MSTPEKATIAERNVAAVEKIAEALTTIGTLMRERLDKDFPARPEPSDATITNVPTAEELLKQEQTGDDANEPLDRWGSIGPREREFEERELAKGSERKSVSPKKPSP